MTISSTTVKNSYSGNGTLDTFNYTFKVFADADIQVIIRDATAEEQAIIDARNKAWEDDATNRKLVLIKETRLKKLEETDWWVLRGNMTTAQSNYRQALRDITSTYNESDYDLLLNRDEYGELTHTVWSKPE